MMGGSQFWAVALWDSFHNMSISHSCLSQEMSKICLRDGLVLQSDGD
jgi:hypothetical protein